MEYQYLRVNYESIVDWQLSTDILRCNQSFHGHPRYDHVIIATRNGHCFARLLRLFKISISTESHLLAYVQSYCRPPGQVRRKDKDLGLYRVRKKANPYEITPIQSIVRGALLVQDSENPNDYFVVDTVDADMFLRMRHLTF